MYRELGQVIVRKVQVAGIDTAVAISVLKTRNLVVREVHRTNGIFGSGVEDIGYLFQLVVRAGERFHVIVSAVISVHIFYLVNLVVVQIDLDRLISLPKACTVLISLLVTSSIPSFTIFFSWSCSG